MRVSFLRIKIPPNLRMYFAVSQNLGDTPKALITRPKNLAQPTSVQKIADKQYMVAFDPSSASQNVDVDLSSAPYSFWASLMSIFTLSFWMGLLPGRDFWRTFNWKTFMVRSMVLTGLLFVALVSLELAGVSVHKPFSRWLNTLEMAERSGNTIKNMFSVQDQFFKSSEAIDFHSRTGKSLDDIYLMTKVENEDGKYRMLVRKDFLPADDLDSAEDICAKELGGVIPTMADYQLFIKGLKGSLNLAFAEWTEEARGIMSDDYQLFIQPELVSTWQISTAEIKGSSGEALTELAKIYDIDRAGMSDDDLKAKMEKRLNRDLRLPSAADVIYNKGVAFFYLDADNQANFRCVRPLPNE